MSIAGIILGGLFGVFFHISKSTKEFISEKNNLFETLNLFFYFFLEIFSFKHENAMKHGSLFHSQFAMKLKHAEHFKLCKQYSHCLFFLMSNYLLFL